MRSAGSVYDEIRWNSKKETWEAVKRIGAIDLGTLDWVYEGIQGSYVFMSLQKSKGIGIKDTTNGMCSRYIHASTKDIIYVDGHIDMYSKWYYEDGNIIIHDSRYSDPNELKNTLNGVMLYYELAEPIITELGNDINLDYEVWDFGTEQMIATEPSAPIKASIVYGFNAVDSVRTAQLEIAELKTQIAQMQAIMASLTAQPVMINE
jgi:hypothetical protein